MARGSLISFTEYQNSRYETAPHHREVAAKLEAVERGEIDRLMLMLPPRHGKLIAHSTPVLTVEGWKTHGDLVVGDQVFGPDGLPAAVVATSDEALATLEVELTNGETVLCHPAHEWTIFYRPHKQWKTVETRWFVEPTRFGKPRVFWTGPRGSRGGRAMLQLPEVAALAFPAADLPLDPYSLGVWLGDGTSVGPKVTMATEDAAHVVPAMEAAGYTLSAQWMHPTTGVPTFSFGGPRPGVAGPLHAGLRDLGLIGAKHVPEVYLRASIEQRLELLAGLVDTDGHVETKTGRIRIVTGDARLRDGIVDLCTTLGFRPYVTMQEPIVSSSGIAGRRQVFTVAFQPTMPIPTRIPRKQGVRLAPQRKVGIADVRPAAAPEMGRCIQVDRADGLYLVGRRLVPTHNSEIASRHFPPWALGRRPERQFISVSATSELAADFGRDVRNIIGSPEYASLFETRLAEDSQARNKWHTDKGGIYYSIGIEGSLIGRGADIMLIDDPFATMGAAQSATERKRVWDWYTGTAYNRLMPGGAIVLIGHRMHDDDLQGRLLAQQAAGGDRWEVVELPALSASGEALWPEKYPVQALERIRLNSIPRYWSALYQQQPAPDTGDYFKRDWLRPVSSLPSPSNLRVYGASDYAVTAGGGDYTVHIIVGIDTDGRLYVLDLWRGQADSSTWIEAFCDLVKKWKPVEWAEENGQIRASLGPFLDRRSLERKAFVYRRQFPTKGDKSVRAQAIRGRMAMQGLHIPADAPWRPDFETELLRFPAGVHDDQVDALGLIGQMLDTINAPSEPKPEPGPGDRYDRNRRRIRIQQTRGSAWAQ